MSAHTDRSVRPALVPGERVLIAESDVSGARIVVSTHAVYHRGDDGWQRLALEEIGRLRWDPFRGVLDLTGFGAGCDRLTLELEPGSHIDALLRERVAAVRIVATRVSLVDGRSALVTARRCPATGEVIWVVSVDDETDANDAGSRGRIDSAIHELRVNAGI